MKPQTQMNSPSECQRFQCNHEFTGLDVFTYLGKGSSNHSSGPMEVFKISIYDPGGLLFCSCPRHKSPCKEYMCPAHRHLHSTLDQSYQNYLTTSLLDIYFFASLMHMERRQDDSYDYPMFLYPPQQDHMFLT